MALEPVEDLAQFRPVSLALPGAPVPAREPAQRERRGASAAASFAAVAIFAAGLTSVLAFGTRPPAPAAARPAPAFASRTPTAAPGLQSLTVTGAGGPAASSPAPFYGETGQIAAVGADLGAPSAAGRHETGSLVPFFYPSQAPRFEAAPSQAQPAPQAQPARAQARLKAPAARAFAAPHLRPMAYHIGVRFSTGWRAGALNSTRVQAAVIAGAGNSRPCPNARPRPAFAVPGDGGGARPARQAFATPGDQSGYSQRLAFQVPAGFAVPGDHGYYGQRQGFQVPQGFAVPGDGGGAQAARQAFPTPGDGGGAQIACNSCR